MTRVDIQAAAELQALLEGVDLPATKQQLLSYAAGQQPRPHQFAALSALPDRLYGSIDDAAEGLVRVQPPREREVPHRPHEESGAPPGGDDYVRRNPESGQVRDLDAVS